MHSKNWNSLVCDVCRVVGAFNAEKLHSVEKGISPAFDARGKSLLESWRTTFLSDWQPPLIFVWFTSKSHDTNNSHAIRSHTKKFEINRTNIKGSFQSVRKVVPHDSRSDLPLVMLCRSLTNTNGWQPSKSSIEFSKLLKNYIIIKTYLIDS